MKFQLNEPTEKAARFRLYDIKEKNAAGGMHHLINAESKKSNGGWFQCPVKDAWFIASPPTKELLVSKTGLTQFLAGVSGMLYIRYFDEVTGVAVGKYVLRHSDTRAGYLHLQDLEDVNTSTFECNLNQLSDLIYRDTHVIFKPNLRIGNFDPPANMPAEKAARFRLYSIGSKGNQLYLTNREGQTFHCNPADAFIVGTVNKTVFLFDPASLFRAIKQHLDGFFWIRFRKTSTNEIREMYAIRTRNQNIAGNLSLRDLSLPSTESRQCVVEEILDIITIDGSRYMYMPNVNQVTGAVLPKKTFTLGSADTCPSTVAVGGGSSCCGIYLLNNISSAAAAPKKTKKMTSTNKRMPDAAAPRQKQKQKKNKRRRQRDPLAWASSDDEDESAEESDADGEEGEDMSFVSVPVAARAANYDGPRTRSAATGMRKKICFTAAAAAAAAASADDDDE